MAVTSSGGCRAASATQTVHGIEMGACDHRGDCSGGRCGFATPDRHVGHAGDGVRRRRVLVGPLVLDEVAAALTGEGVRVLAEATLAVVLLADASRINLSPACSGASLRFRCACLPWGCR
jgi:hypothetical protein